MGESTQPQDQTPLLTALRLAAQKSDAAFHTPGHRRGRGVSSALSALLGDLALQADLPELPELDNLFAPSRVIHSAQMLAAEAFGADRTWFLANGSTSGIMAAIAATCAPGDKIILPRNSHRSAIAGLILTGAVPVFMPPDIDPVWGIAHGIAPATLTETLALHPTAKAVMLVHPTYYGVCGDLAAMAQICQAHPMPLLVDEAHGAHFAFHPALPITALAAGADVSVQSSHKTLMALTQAAMLHLKGDRVDPQRIANAFALVQSTSPNYLLLASLDAARSQMATTGNALLTHALALADQARSRLAAIPRITVLQPDHLQSAGAIALDYTRLTVRVADLGLDGFTVDARLCAEFGIVAELPTLLHLTFIITHGNTEADIDRLVHAFTTFATEASASTPPIGLQSSFTQLPPATTACSPRDAFFAPAIAVPIAAARDRISAELICPYPPGIPVLIPGEVISEAAIAYLQAILANGGILTGCTDPTLKTITVLQKA